LPARANVSDITQLVSRYAFFIDRGKVSELANLFVDDGLLITPTWEAHGRAAIISRLSAAADPAKRRPQFVRHHVTSIAIEDQDNYTAAGRAYYLVITESGLDHAGVYVDEYFQIKNEWLIKKREVRLDWASPASLLAPAPPMRDRNAGVGDL